MNTAERLSGYYPFTPEVIEQVADVAEWQSKFTTYGDFFNAMGIEEPSRVTFDGYYPSEFIDIRQPDANPYEALVYHLPMANALDPNQLYQIATIAKANPGHRVIAMGNPSGRGFDAGLLNHEQRKKVANGNLEPVVEPLLKYLDKKKINKARHVGYSYGVDLAAVAAAHGDQEVDRAVVIEPASVVRRNLAKLAINFHSTVKEASRYVNASDLETFIEARKDSVGPTAYALSLTRFTNIAIARGLAKGGFQDRLDTAIEAQPDMKTTLAWGTESELAINSLVSLYGYCLARRLEPGRLVPLPLKGQKHALANDIHLQAAIVLEGLK